MDNYGTHKHQKVLAGSTSSTLCLPFHPYQFQLAEPRRAMVRRIDNKALREASLSVLPICRLIAAILLAAWNENPKPFVWTATIESIVEKLARCRQTLEKIQPGCTSPKTRKRRKIAV